MGKAEQAALKWLRDHGGDCAVAKSKKGGRFFLAQGETGPFTYGTVKKLVEAGIAEFYNGKQRLRLVYG
jgi:hypothetical protein